MTTTMTRAELLTACEDAFDRATNSKATKASLQRLLDGIERSDKEAIGPPVSRLELLDGANQATTFDLNTGEMTSVATPGTFPNAVAITGAGPVMTVDLHSMYLWQELAICFDVSPGSPPVSVVFSDPDAAQPLEEDAEDDTENAPEQRPATEDEPGSEAGAVEEEAPAADETQADGSENGAILPDAEESQVDPNEESVT